MLVTSCDPTKGWTRKFTSEDFFAEWLLSKHHIPTIFASHSTGMSLHQAIQASMPVTQTLVTTPRRSPSDETKLELGRALNDLLGKCSFVTFPYIFDLL